jgi:phosphatidylinositol glycan class V
MFLLSRDNGFLRYWRPSNIPLFLIASPTLFVSLLGVYRTYLSDPTRFLTLGLRGKQDRKLPYFYLLLFMLLYTVLFAHVQIVVRVFTFLPAFYWAQAELVVGSRTKGGEDGGRWWIAMCAGHAAVGTVLFGVFLPPA